MATRSFAVTWDYRCPFAYRAHDHLVTALLAGGTGWDLAFVPFSLGQVHVKEGETDIWERPGDDSGLLALQVGVAVRDRHPEAFPALHRAVFEIRHRHAGRLDDEGALRAVLAGSGLDADAVLAEVATGGPLDTIRKEHESAVASHTVWGVPTFIVDDQAVFVRLMNRSDGDAGASRAVIERLLDLAGGWPELNELKHTTVPR